MLGMPTPPIPPPILADHNIVHLVPKYTSKVKKRTPTKEVCKNVDGWCQWETERFRPGHRLGDSAGLMDITSTARPTASQTTSNSVWGTQYLPEGVRCFSNNKLWVTPSSQGPTDREVSYYMGTWDREDERRVQHKLKNKTRQAKKSICSRTMFKTYGEAERPSMATDR